MIYVVDASVFNKLYLDEPDKGQAEAFFRHCGEQRHETVAPTLLMFEAFRTALHFGLPVKVPMSLIDGLGGLNFVPVPGHWGTLPLSVKGAPNGTTATEVHRRL